MDRKRRRYSKKSKANLRKFTDVKDVEEFLEEKRIEERTGGCAAEKADEELYFVAKEGGESDDKSTGGKWRKRLKPLRSEANLQPDTRVPPFPGRKRKKLQSRKQKLKDSSVVSLEDSGVGDSSSDEEYDQSVTYAQIRQQQRTMVATKETLQMKPVARDLWADSEVTKPADIPDQHYLKVTRKKPIKIPNTMRMKPSALESLEVPPPGTSYNPTFEDHQDLLRLAVDIEERKLRAAEKLEKKLQLASMTCQQREHVWLEEMTEGLFGGEGQKEEEEEEEEDEGRDAELPPFKRPVRAEDRKSKKQRRKAREMKEEAKKRQTEKEDRIKMEDVFRLRSIKKEIADKEVAVAEKERRRLETEKQSLYQTRRLGKHTYEAPDLDLQLSSEISGSLRCLKPEGSLAVDRFKSLQKRNIIEPREVVRPHRRYKVKEKEKRSARLPEEGPIW